MLNNTLRETSRKPSIDLLREETDYGFLLARNRDPLGVLEDEFLTAIWLPLRVVWIRTKHDGLPVRRMANEEVVDLLISETTLNLYGYRAVARLIHMAIDIHGYSAVRDFIASKMLFE